MKTYCNLISCNYRDPEPAYEDLLVLTSKPLALLTTEYQRAIARRALMLTYPKLQMYHDLTIESIHEAAHGGAQTRMGQKCTIARPLTANKNDGFVFVEPIGAVKMTLMLCGKNNSANNTAYILTVPSNIFNADCDGRAVYDLLQQIVKEYNDEGFTSTNNSFVNAWNQISKIPPRTLNRYGVALEDLDTAATITLDANWGPWKDKGANTSTTP